MAAKDGGDASPPAPAGRGLASVIFFVLLWCSWIIFLAGTAAGQKACEDAINGSAAAAAAAAAARATNQNIQNAQNAFGRKLLEAQRQEQHIHIHGVHQHQQQQAVLSGRRLLSASHPGAGRRHLMASTSTTCSTAYSLPWWLVWFEFLCISLAMVLALSSVIQKFKLSVVQLFVMETTLLMWLAGEINNVLLTTSNSGGTQGQLHDAASAQMAGVILLLLLNLIYIIVAASEVAGIMPAVTGVKLPDRPEWTKPKPKTAEPSPPDQEARTLPAVSPEPATAAATPARSSKVAPAVAGDGVAAAGGKSSEGGLPAVTSSLPGINGAASNGLPEVKGSKSPKAK